MRKNITGLVLGGMLFASSVCMAAGSSDIKFAILAPIQANQSNSVLTDTYPILFSLEFAKQFEVQGGFGNIGQGEKQDSYNRFGIQGAWYAFKNESLKYGPMVGFYTFAFGQKASDNTMNSIYFGLAARKNIWENIDLKLDAIGFALNSGKVAGADIKENNALLPGITLSLTFNLI